MLLGSQGSENAISRPEKKGQSSVTIHRKAIPSCGGLLFAGFNCRGLEEQHGSVLSEFSYHLHIAEIGWSKSLQPRNANITDKKKKPVSPM